MSSNYMTRWELWVSGNTKIIKSGSSKNRIVQQKMKSKDIVSVIKNLPTMKHQGPDTCIIKIYEILKDLIIMILKLFQTTEEGKTFTDSFYEGCITLMSKPDTDTREKKTTDPYPLWMQM